MIPISFMGANYVARQLGYKMTQGWGQGDKATQDYFRPIETFEQRFEQILKDVKSLGFSSMDIWIAHLHWQWATDKHIEIAKRLLAKHNMKVVSLAGGFGDTPEQLESACRLANALGTNILGGGTGLIFKDRPAAVSIFQKQHVRLGIENHPEKTPKDLLDKIGDGGNGTIGACIDTGWFGTQGYDAAQAIEELKDYLVHIHLKDVTEVGKHRTCQLGKGCVPIKKCIQVLKKLNYKGTISIEHEPEDFDPTEDCRISLQLVLQWLKE